MGPRLHPLYGIGGTHTGDPGDWPGDTLRRNQTL